MTTYHDRPQAGVMYDLSALMRTGRLQAPTELELGQIVSYQDMANPYQEAVVIAHSPSYGSRVLFLEDGHESTVTDAEPGAPAGFRLHTGRVLRGEEFTAAVQRAREAAARIRGERELENGKRAEQDRLERDRIIQEYPHLERLDGTTKSSYALAAANIRRELKVAFPGVKFSVRSRSFSGGDSVDIDWNGGPTDAEVQEIARKYQCGDFDAMEDLYRYRHSVWTAVFGSAKYVMTQRSWTPAEAGKVA